MAESTRDKLLGVALEQFSERGFDGVSIANIADALQLSKQALLHHFSTKEKLYGEVLASISADFEARIQAIPESSDPEALVQLLKSFATDAREHRPQTTLLMRELLDNSARARSAGHWYLRPFLDLLLSQVQTLPGWSSAEEARVLACVYQILGAINYFAISRDTLGAMYGENSYRELENVFDEQLALSIRSTLQAGLKGA